MDNKPDYYIILLVCKWASRVKPVHDCTTRFSFSSLVYSIMELTVTCQFKVSCKCCGKRDLRRLSQFSITVRVVEV